MSYRKHGEDEDDALPIWTVRIYSAQEPQLFRIVE